MVLHRCSSKQAAHTLLVFAILAASFTACAGARPRLYKRGRLRLRVRKQTPYHNSSINANSIFQSQRTDNWPTAPYHLQPVEGFVKAEGINLVLNGKPWFFTGTNAFNLAQYDEHTEEDIDIALKMHARNGLKVVRIFAFSNGFNISNIHTFFAIQPVLRKFAETPLQRLDYILAAGGKYGLRFVMVLGNYEPELGGMHWYVDSVLGEGKDPMLFYTHPKVKKAFKNYLTTIITRNNSITGIRYSDDPAILAWEPMNEPHTLDNYELNKGQTPGRMVWGWLKEMTSHIRSLDKNHLIGTGEEGYRTSGKACFPHFHWINGGTKGVDFVANIQLPDVDYGTLHVYPDNWNISADEFEWVNVHVIQDRAALAHAVGKPLILEEFGMRENYHLHGRDPVIQSLAWAANDNSVAGTLVWQLWHRELVFDTFTKYDFAYNHSGTKAILEQADYTNALNLGIEKPVRPLYRLPKAPEPCPCIDIVPPGTNDTCWLMKQHGKCNMAWMTTVWPPLCASPEGFCAKTCGRCSC